MKPTGRLRSFLATICYTVPAISSAPAADGTWTRNATGTQNWSDTTNWADGDVADGIGFSAFLSDVITADRTITLDGARTIGNIYAQDTSHNYTISGADTLTLDASSGQSILNVVTAGRTLTIGTAVTVNDGIEKTGNGAVSITGAVTLGAAQTWTNNSSGAFTKTNASLLDNNGNQLTFDGTGIFNLGTINSATAVLTGSGNLVKNGTGRVNIGGVNSGFTGTVTVNGGVLQMTNNAGGLGTGNLTLNGGVLSSYWSMTYSRTLGTGANQVQILGGESGFAGAGTTGPTFNLGTSVQWGSTYFNPTKFVLGDEGTTNSGITTFSSGIDLNGGTRTIVVPKGLSAGGNRSTISGAISNSTGTGGLIKEGDGYLLFSNNASAWNGTTTVSAGLLDMGGLNENNIGGGSARNISVAAGASIRFNALGNNILNRIVETSDEFTVMTGATSNNLDFSSSTGANLSNAFLGNYASNGAKAEYNGILTPASDNYRLGSPGSSGLLGMRQVMGGTQGLIVGGSRVNLVAANTFSGETEIRSGAKLTIGNNLALQNSALNVGAAGGNFALAAGTNAGRITGETAAPSPTFGGLIGSRDLISVFTTSGGNNETNLSASAVTGFTLNVGTGNTHTYSGAIGGFGAGASGSTGGASTFTKTGDGTQILSGTSSYTGATDVVAGTLIIDGNISTSVLTTVKTGATLGGSGTIGDLTIDAGGFFTPGNSPGITTVDGDYIQNGTLVSEITGLTPGTGGHDQVIVNGTVTLNGALNLAFNTFTPVNGDLIFILLNDDVDAVTGTFSGLAQGAVAGTYGGYNWQISYTADSTADTFTGTLNGNDIALMAVAIPEPHAALLGGLGLFLVLRRRRD